MHLHVKCKVSNYQNFCKYGARHAHFRGMASQIGDLDGASETSKKMKGMAETKPFVDARIASDLWKSTGRPKRKYKDNVCSNIFRGQMSHNYWIKSNPRWSETTIVLRGKYHDNIVCLPEMSFSLFLWESKRETLVTLAKIIGKAYMCILMLFYAKIWC